MTRALVSGVVALIIAILLGGPVVRMLEARVNARTAGAG